jgi:uncharacterized membrane protein YhhN
LKKQAWIVLFSIALVANIIAGLIKSQLLDYISKPLIVIAVAAYFISGTGPIKSSLKIWILAALFFSWMGDILLMFQEKNASFFLMGLSSFLLAHVCYIIFFHRVRVAENIRRVAWPAIVVVIYYAALIIFLSPYLGDMKLPVRIYGLVISFMFMLALHMLMLKNKIAGQCMILGALLFVASDSVLAINKFYQSFETAGVIIMLTYGLAQLFIIEGARRYITFNSKE